MMVVVDLSKQYAGIIRQINQLNLGQKIGLKQMMICVERITPIAKLNLKLQC